MLLRLRYYNIKYILVGSESCLYVHNLEDFAMTVITANLNEIWRKGQNHSDGNVSLRIGNYTQI